ncbi:hypothetical protein Tco_1493865 [Tanacetum coccineum]
MVPRTLLTKSGPISLNTTRPINTVQPRIVVNNAGPMKNVINKTYSTARRPFNKITAANNSNFTKKVNIARPKVVLSAVKGNKGNAGNPQQDLKGKGVIDSGCSRHMTRNRSYLIDYGEIDGGFVAFGGNSKGEKITRKGKIRTGKLDFEDVYFVKELKLNLFSVSQICDKKNSVLFTNTTCVVLSLDFKLTDESHVLLKVPRKDNMYIVDLKNVTTTPHHSLKIQKNYPDAGFKPSEDDGKKDDANPRIDSKGIDQEKDDDVNIPALNNIIMANVPSNDPNVDAPANPENAPAQYVGHGDGFHPWVGGNIPNNQNGWMEEDPEEDPEENNDDDWEMDDEAEVIEPYTGDDLNNPPPPVSEDEETPPTSPVIPDADGGG